MDGLREAPTNLRGPITRGTGRVDRAGGDNSAGVIRQLSVVTRGEALGHGMWLDKDFTGSVRDAINAAPNGVKSRFTHPGLSGDGLAHFLGRVNNARTARSGNIVKADLHFAETAHNTPDGNLAAYVMDLAEADPSAFGTSIVFTPDYDAEDEHRRDNPKSPDKDNKQNLPHVRLGRLRADDIVDEPAANPDGVFTVGHTPRDADKLLSYAFGLTDDPGELATLFDVSPDRVRGFVTRWLEYTNHVLVDVATMDTAADRDRFIGDKATAKRVKELLAMKAET
jgi:hypothetical protein